MQGGRNCTPARGTGRTAGARLAAGRSRVPSAFVYHQRARLGLVLLSASQHCGFGLVELFNLTLITTVSEHSNRPCTGSIQPKSNQDGAEQSNASKAVLSRDNSCAASLDASNADGGRNNGWEEFHQGQADNLDKEESAGAAVWGKAKETEDDLAQAAQHAIVAPNEGDQKRNQLDLDKAEEGDSQLFTLTTIKRLFDQPNGQDELYTQQGWYLVPKTINTYKDKLPITFHKEVYLNYFLALDKQFWGCGRRYLLASSQQPLKPSITSLPTGSQAFQKVRSTFLKQTKLGAVQLQTGTPSGLNLVGQPGALS